MPACIRGSARTLSAALLTTLATAALLLLTSGSAAAAGECDLVASTNGSDQAAGTASDPLRTAEAMIDQLEPGQTGCLLGDGVFDADDKIKVDVAGVVLSSYPGTRATLKGRLWVAADGVRVENLNLDGRSSMPTKRSPTITAADVVFRGNDVTNHHGASSCFGLGSDWGRAVRTVIENNSIHNCGVKGTNLNHGVYLQESDGVVIRNNFIFDNADRGIQLYPDAQRTAITGNVIDGNGSGVIFSGKDSRVSNDTLLANNVIANSKIRWNVESGGDGPIASGNQVRDNCVWASNAKDYYNQDSGVQPDSKNFSATDNTTAKPIFVDRSSGDLRLDPASGCAGVLSGEIGSGGTGDSAGGTKEKVKIKPSRRNLRSGAKLRIRGKAPGARKVKLLVKRGGKWRRVKKARTRKGGAHFRSKLRVRSRKPRKLKFKAAATGLRDSRPVRVRVKRR